VLLLLITKGGKRIYKMCSDQEARIRNKTLDFGHFGVSPGGKFYLQNFPGIVDLAFTTKWLNSKNITYPEIIGCAIYGPYVHGVLHHTKFVAPLDAAKDFAVQWVWGLDQD
jgi:hypothetical protein